MAFAKQHPLLACTCLAFLWRCQAMRMQINRNAVENKAKWCWLSGSNELKKYYFEFAFDPLVPEEHTAIALVRDPQRPTLNIHKVSKWVVRTPPKDKDSDLSSDLHWIPDVRAPDEMEWLAACMKDFGSCNEPNDYREIDLMNVSYIRKVLIPVNGVAGEETFKEGEAEIGIEITYEDGEKDEFEGGIYMPRRLMLPAMQRAERENFKFNGLARDAKESASSFDTMLSQAMYTFRNTATGTIVAGTGTGATGGVSVGIGIGAVAALTGAPGLTGFALGTLVAGAGFGLVAGAGAGLVLGGVIGTVSGGTMALWDYHKQKKELGFAATEKIWNKLECHNLFTHCNETIIVPQGKACPEN